MRRLGRVVRDHKGVGTDPFDFPHTSMISIASMKNDDENFLGLVRVVADHIVQQLHPESIFLIRTDHWFDHKWLGFSGKVLGAIAVSKPRLTLPPFVPNRILSQESYSFDTEANAYRRHAAPLLHLAQPSSDNLTRFIDRVSQAGLFLWFSGDTQKNANGAMMVYTVMGDSLGSWYASFRKAEAWQIYRLRGISRSQVLHLAEGALHGPGA